MLLKAEYESIRVINTAELVVLREFYDMHASKSFTFFFIFYNIAFHVSTFVSVFKGIRGSNPDSVSETFTSLIYQTFSTSVHNDVTNIS